MNHTQIKNDRIDSPPRFLETQLRPAILFRRWACLAAMTSVAIVLAATSASGQTVGGVSPVVRSGQIHGTSATRSSSNPGWQTQTRTEPIRRTADNSRSTNWTSSNAAIPRSVNADGAPVGGSNVGSTATKHPLVNRPGADVSNPLFQSLSSNESRLSAAPISAAPARPIGSGVHSTAKVATQEDTIRRVSLEQELYQGYPYSSQGTGSSQNAGSNLQFQAGASNVERNSGMPVNDATRYAGNQQYGNGSNASLELANRQGTGSGNTGFYGEGRTAYDYSGNYQSTYPTTGPTSSGVTTQGGYNPTIVTQSPAPTSNVTTSVINGSTVYDQSIQTWGNQQSGAVSTMPFSSTGTSTGYAPVQQTRFLTQDPGYYPNAASTQPALGGIPSQLPSNPNQQGLGIGQSNSNLNWQPSGTTTYPAFPQTNPTTGYSAANSCAPYGYQTGAYRGVGNYSGYRGYSATGSYKPIVAFRPPSSSAYLGQGVLGQPKAYVEGEPFRNFFRYILP